MMEVRYRTADVLIFSEMFKCLFVIYSPHLRTPEPAAQPQDPDHHGLHGGARGLHGLQHPDGGVQQRRPEAAGRVEG